MMYDEAVAYLNSFTNYERQHDPEAMRAVRLERMRRLCERVGDPQRQFRSVLVAGTNGKGSICAMLYSMLRESPLCVGLYTSPHLKESRERIRVWSGSAGLGERMYRDDWIREEAFAATVEEVRPVLEDIRRGPAEHVPTYFEVLTAIAFMYFRQRKVQLGVFEVGLGGRLDATNILEQAVSIMAPIDVDHADVLGADPVTIAKEKAGIIKPHQVVLSASQSEEVLEVLRATCDAQGVPLFTVEHDLTVRISRHDLEGLHVSVTGLRGIYEALEIPLIGRHQATNAALAIGALESLSTTGVPYGLVERGLSQVEWPGRLEVVHEAPLVIMDGAHNPQAAGALSEALQELCQGRTIHLLIGMSADKPVEDVGKRLGALAISATCTQSRHPRALDPTVLATRLFPFCHDVHVMSDPIDAYTYLLNAVSSNDVIIVTGSLFLVGELRSALEHSHIMPRRRLIAA